MFATYTSSLSRALSAADPDLAAKPPSHEKPTGGDAKAATPAAPSTTHDPAKIDKIEDLLQKYEYNFTKHLKILIDALDYLAATETATFLNLSARLSTAVEGMSDAREINHG